MTARAPLRGFRLGFPEGLGAGLALGFILGVAAPDAPAAEPAPCVGEIAHVVDGDTLDVACAGGAPLRLRLANVDAPETRACQTGDAGGCAWCGPTPEQRAAAGRVAAHGRAVRALVEANLGPTEDLAGVIVSARPAYADRWGRAVGDAVILEGVFRGLTLIETIHALGEQAGVETLRPWPHDDHGRELVPGSRPVWCEGAE